MSQAQHGIRSMRFAGYLLGALAFTAVSTKLLQLFSPSQSKDTLVIISTISFLLFILLAIGWTIVAASRVEVRFGLGQMLKVIWGGAASVTCIVGSHRAEIMSLGITGLLILSAYLIAAIARSGGGKIEE
jgi:hypothetical protein